MADAFNERLVKLGTTRVQWIALYYLGLYSGISQTELSELMDTKRSSTTRLMDRMEKEGLIIRSKDQKDRRITRIYLSHIGKATREDLLPEGEKMSEKYAQGISREDILVFKKVLQEMVDNASK